MPFHHLPRRSLGFFPTPIVELPRLSQSLGGPRILIKRDDQTGLALGGNKTRKLEFLIADALHQNCDCVITAGAAQSNHCRQTAAAAAMVGLECHLVLGGTPPEQANGNLLLDEVLGATIHWTGADRKGEQLNAISSQLQAQDHHPYVIPYGGSNALGAVGFVAAMAELQQQLQAMEQSMDAIVFASSSGGTQAGLTVGRSFLAMDVELIGIRIDKAEDEQLSYGDQLAELATSTAKMLQSECHFHPADFRVETAYLGAGYGVVGDLERSAINLLAQSEGILLDPVYSGRAMGGLLDLIRRGHFHRQQTVLFWHTGGQPALFAPQFSLKETNSFSG
ncbi:D-cysteine desulfhydrase family protein [Acaryochloris marina]|uniref:D-cysteine desulfhydrase family protein n=1 Tax=Acaryochloris marina TaxID=155978 RepID=UPI001BAED10D|nr:D-cysteine desulfhydrase family protein [Acaryochloris marina]QUY41469.1 D-cysteine desulfhydrase family protein [Acaryochloris marina S15]